MFTGIIEEIGTMKQIARKGQAMVLTLSAKRVLEDVHLGDSISVNGVCLTVTSFNSTTFTVDVMPETYRHTNLKLLTSGSPVNLERAMVANGRFGGHIVQGHVDTYGTISSRQADENAVVFTIELSDATLFKYIIPRGSITVDGISLTVVSTSSSHFSISIIPHTLAQTVLQHKQPGDTINIECDLLGKYVEHLLSYGRSGGESSTSTTKSPSKLSAAFLAENGFL